MATPLPMTNHDPTSPTIQLDNMNKDIPATSNMPSSDPSIGSNMILQVTPPTPPRRYNDQQLLRLVPSAIQRNSRPLARSLKIKLHEKNASVKVEELPAPTAVLVTKPEAKIVTAAIDPKKISADAENVNAASKVDVDLLKQVSVDRSGGKLDGEVDDAAWEKFVCAMAKAIEIQGPDDDEERAEAAKLVDDEILEVFNDVKKDAAEKAKAFVEEIKEVTGNVKAASETVEAVVSEVEYTNSKSGTADLTAENIQQQAKEAKAMIKGVKNGENFKSATENTVSELKDHPVVDDKLVAKLKGPGIKADETSGKKISFEEDADVTKETEKKAANFEAPKRKKKASKTRYANGTPKPKKVAATGFEEFYADAPITPEEYEEEMQNIYHHSRDFAERIETCISRYRSKRKLNSLRGDMFNKYLELGGVDTGFGKFQGRAKKERAKDTATPDTGIDDDYGGGPTVHNICEEYRPMFDGNSILDMSQNAVSRYFNPLAPQNWTVDFIGIAKAFLGKKAPWTFGVSEKATIDAYCEVVNNFLAYVLMHSVCPEYTNEILAAQKIARLAKKELWAVKTLMDIFPGPFHTALAILSDPTGFLAETRLCTTTQLETAKELTGEEFNADKHMTFEQCKTLVEVTLTLMGMEAQIDTLLSLLESMKKGDSLPVVKTEESAFEILSITMPTEETVEDFKAFSSNFIIKSTGLIHVRPWSYTAEEMSEDLTPVEARKAAKAKQEAFEAKRKRDANPQNAFKLDGDLTSTESFVISADILEHCFVGMKFDCVIKTISVPTLKASTKGVAVGKGSQNFEGQLRFIDSLSAAHVSFYESVDNEKMEGWRIPVETDRIPPTCNDEEGANLGPEHCDADDEKKKEKVGSAKGAEYDE